MVYEFKCQCGKTKEVRRLIRDRHLPCNCDSCGKPMERNYKSLTNVVVFKPVFTTDITGEPMRFDSKKKLFEECAKHGCHTNLH